jgi:hypothetical protein
LGNGPVGNAASGISFPFLAQKILFGAPFPLTRINATPPSSLTTTPFSTVQAFPPILKLPYSYQWNLSLEQSLGTEQSISIAFIGAAGHDLLRTEEYFGGLAGVPAKFGQVLVTSNSGFSDYSSLQVQFRRRSNRGAHVIASYTLAHALDNVSTDTRFDGVPSRFLNPRKTYGASDFDVRHTAVLGLDFHLPPQRNGRVVNRLFSNWFVDPIVTLRSALPVDVVILRDIGFGTYPLYPDLVRNAPLYVHDQAAPGGRRINPGALSIPTSARQGNLNRNFFRGFPFVQTDVAVGRRLQISNRLDVSVRVEAFNVLNHPNFSSPVGQFGRVDSSGRFIQQSGFGASQTILAQGLQSGAFNTGFSPLYQIGGTRSIQLALKLGF